MKNQKAECVHMRALRQRLASLSMVGCAIWGLTAVLAMMPGLAAAQMTNSVGAQSMNADSGALAADGAAPIPNNTADRRETVGGVSGHSGVRLTPRITIQQTFTSNAQLSAAGNSDQITEVMPGFSLVSNTARLRGFVDYTLRGVHYARGSASDQIWHNLNAHATVEAIQKWFYVDLDGWASLQQISAFGAPGSYTPANPNLTQTTSYRVSPYLRGYFANNIDYETRYGFQNIRSGTLSRSNITINDWLIHVGERPVGQILGWGVDATQQKVSYSNGRDVDTTTLRGRLNYFLTPQLRFSAIAGGEWTNQLSPVKEFHDIVGLGFDWRSSERTHIYFEGERRYFGESHNGGVEYRTSRTVWRYSDRKNINNGLGFQSGSVGSLVDLFDGFYARVEPDPIRRMQMVQAEIARLGLPADMRVFPDYLTSSSTLQRLQTLSLALLGRRTTLTFEVMQSDTKRLQGALQVADDFANNQRIRQRGWNVILGHRLTKNSTINAGFADAKSIGSAAGWDSRTRSLFFGWNVLIAPRTNFGLQLRRISSTGSLNRYNESAVIGLITHRF